MHFKNLDPYLRSGCPKFVLKLVKMFKRWSFLGFGCSFILVEDLLCFLVGLFFYFPLNLSRQTIFLGFGPPPKGPRRNLSLDNLSL